MKLGTDSDSHSEPDSFVKLAIDSDSHSEPHSIFESVALDSEPHSEPHLEQRPEVSRRTQ